MQPLTVSEIRDMILDQGLVGAIVINLAGTILYATNEYQERYGDGESIIGKYLLDVLPGSGLLDIIENPKVLIGKCNRDHKGNYLFGNRIPLYKDGVLVGALGTLLFSSLEVGQFFSAQIDKLQKQVNKYEEKIRATWSPRYSVDDIIVKSPKMASIRAKLPRIAVTDMPVLITGETGVGKEIIANALHSSSARRERCFVQINCAAIPKDLMESELFGYEGGAFTGSRRDGKIGSFEIADGGTLFLDEIGELPYEMQAKLLRVLQEGEIVRIGGTQKKRVNVRIIAATNRDLPEMIRSASFREDLYYRLSGVRIDIPPLRERVEDIPSFVEMAIHSAEIKHGLSRVSGPKTLSPEAMACVLRADWPGNVRELLNVLEYSYCMTDSQVIHLSDFPEYFAAKCERSASPQPASQPPEPQAQRTEREQILSALEKTGGNKNAAAQLLGIHRVTLYKKIAKLGLEETIRHPPAQREPLCAADIGSK